MMLAVACQSQTEAVFVSSTHTLTLWPVWMLSSLHAWLLSIVLQRPARLVARPICLRLAFPPSQQSLSDSFSVFLSDCSPGYLRAASLLSSYIFLPFPPACQVLSCQSLLFSGRSFVVASTRLSVCLSGVWLPS